MINKIQFPSSMIDSSISLRELGIKELAWKWKDIKQVIDFLVEKKYAILGGDVYLLNNDQKIQTYDSWYIDRETGISWLDYVKKGKNVTVDYINQYYVSNGDSYCYSIICAKQ